MAKVKTSAGLLPAESPRRPSLSSSSQRLPAFLNRDSSLCLQTYLSHVNPAIASTSPASFLQGRWDYRRPSQTHRQNLSFSNSRVPSTKSLWPAVLPIMELEVQKDPNIAFLNSEETTQNPSKETPPLLTRRWWLPGGK